MADDKEEALPDASHGRAFGSLRDLAAGVDKEGQGGGGGGRARGHEEGGGEAEGLGHAGEEEGREDGAGVHGGGLAGDREHEVAAGDDGGGEGGGGGLGDDLRGGGDADGHVNLPDAEGSGGGEEPQHEEDNQRDGMSGRHEVLAVHVVGEGATPEEGGYLDDELDGANQAELGG